MIEVLVDTMLMLDGGKRCADIDMLGSQGRLFGGVCSDSTLWTFTGSMDGEAVVRARAAVANVEGVGTFGVSARWF